MVQLRRGYLTKQSTGAGSILGKNWRRRFVVLAANPAGTVTNGGRCFISWYERSDESHAKGSMVITASSEVKPNASENSFKLTTPQGSLVARCADANDFT